MLLHGNDIARNTPPRRAAPPTSLGSQSQKRKKSKLRTAHDAWSCEIEKARISVRISISRFTSSECSTTAFITSPVTPWALHQLRGPCEFCPDQITGTSTELRRSYCRFTVSGNGERDLSILAGKLPVLDAVEEPQGLKGRP
ncbi:hypothetical protein CIHG_08589 [Coccidioides immitis H538.4]|uniref:Uncharacterized protein n=2 Tax=Coccidioides immitis TaxID=5501 RepID=A0A0J8UT90_COCIT|nr:hypothetical protein CIRG_09785 [Coccidioides immitis RMSCC 2394]KMU90933.1 hypothetical protein CIHG_08589 [Coccidioides immitis H538.4]